jgi:hypothetical protein
MSSRAAVESRLSSMGPGTRAIVFVRNCNPRSGHVFNAMFGCRGRVSFYNGQSGTTASFSGYTEFRVLITNP